MHLKMSSAKCQPFCSGFTALTLKNVYIIHAIQSERSGHLVVVSLSIKYIALVDIYDCVL